jgi:hypothetical protein
MTTIADVRRAHPQWFFPGNKRFFGNISYAILHGKVTKNPYMVRKTNIWSDMFGGEKTYVYRINPIDKNTLEIGWLIDDVFKTIDDVKKYLKEA